VRRMTKPEASPARSSPSAQPESGSVVTLTL
jgi:hypothetical protein